jgi:H+-transporting ATPase
MWSSKPGAWVVASSAVDVAIVLMLASSGTMMEALPIKLLLAMFIAAAGFAVVLDQVKLAVLSGFGLS